MFEYHNSGKSLARRLFCVFAQCVTLPICLILSRWVASTLCVRVDYCQATSARFARWASPRAPTAACTSASVSRTARASDARAATPSSSQRLGERPPPYPPPPSTRTHALPTHSLPTHSATFPYLPAPHLSPLRYDTLPPYPPHPYPGGGSTSAPLAIPSTRCLRPKNPNTPFSHMWRPHFSHMS